MTSTHSSNGASIGVLDTEYKRPKTPSANDIEQIVAYAVSKHCEEAALICPVYLENPVSTCVGGTGERPNQGLQAGW